jgi:hypothetical protein
MKVLKTGLAYIHANLFSIAVYNKVGRDHKLLSDTIKEISDIRDKLNKINRSEADAVRLCFSKNEGFKVLCEISCILEGKDLVVSEDMKDSSVNDV